MQIPTRGDMRARFGVYSRLWEQEVKNCTCEARMKNLIGLRGAVPTYAFRCDETTSPLSLNGTSRFARLLFCDYSLFLLAEAREQASLCRGHFDLAVRFVEEAGLASRCRALLRYAGGRGVLLWEAHGRRLSRSGHCLRIARHINGGASEAVAKLDPERRILVGRVERNPNGHVFGKVADEGQCRRHVRGRCR